MTKEKLLEYVNSSSLELIQKAILEDDFKILEKYSEETFIKECNKPIPAMVKNYLRTQKLKQYD